MTLLVNINNIYRNIVVYVGRYRKFSVDSKNIIFTVVDFQTLKTRSFFTNKNPTIY